MSEGEENFEYGSGRMQDETIKGAAKELEEKIKANRFRAEQKYELKNTIF